MVDFKALMEKSKAQHTANETKPETQPEKKQPLKLNFSEQKKAALASISKPSPAPQEAPIQKTVETDVLDNLTLDVETQPEISADEYNFEDQPEKLQEAVVADVKKSLALLADNINNKELVGQAVKSVLSDLQKHDFLRDILQPEDLGLMVRGLRESYGRAVQQKTERKKKTTATNAAVDSILNDLANVEFNV